MSVTAACENIRGGARFNVLAVSNKIRSAFANSFGGTLTCTITVSGADSRDVLGKSAISCHNCDTSFTASAERAPFSRATCADKSRAAAIAALEPPKRTARCHAPDAFGRIKRAVFASNNSIASGGVERFQIFGTAVHALFNWSKDAQSDVSAVGLGKSLTVASVIMPSVPNAPAC